jgi:hypothetical protein
VEKDMIKEDEASSLCDDTFTFAVLTCTGFHTVRAVLYTTPWEDMIAGSTFLASQQARCIHSYSTIIIHNTQLLKSTCFRSMI